MIIKVIDTKDRIAVNPMYLNDDYGRLVLKYLIFIFFLIIACKPAEEDSEAKSASVAPAGRYFDTHDSLTMPLFCQEDPHVAVDQAKLEKLINPKPDSSTENMGPLVKFMVANDHEKKAFLDGLKTHSLAELENSFAETGLMIACALKEAIELEQLTEQEIKDYRYQITPPSRIQVP